MFRTILIVVSVLVCAGSTAMAQSCQDIIDKRQAFMKKSADMAKIGSAMIKGETPFDLAKAKEILRAVKRWSEEHGHPFFFSTEASLNLSDDEELLTLMRDLDFRYVFVGIESGDHEVLVTMQKQQNAKRNLLEALNKIQRHGIVVNGGFIVGCDGETSDSARKMVEVIERGNVVMSMVGLMYALPNTQLTRRLKQEHRLLEDTGKLNEAAEATQVDQTTSGLNFITRRPRAQVLGDFLHVLKSVYSTRNYFDRCLRVSKVLRVRPRFKPPLKRMVRYGLAFLKIVVKLGLRPSTSYYYWRNFLNVLFTRVSSLESVVNLMAMYLHFKPQTEFVSGLMATNIKMLQANAAEDAHTAHRPEKAELSR